jgi:flagellar biosynthesis protein FliR
MAPSIIPTLDAAAAVPAAIGLVARMAAAVAVGGFPLPPGVSVRIRVALAVALAAAALPAAATAGVAPVSLPLLVAGEAVVGLGLGLAAAAVLAAAGWAGAILGSVSGLSWADDFAADGDPQAAGAARLAWWLGLAGFLAAGGHLAVVAGLLDSVHAIPVGGGPAAVGWVDRVTVATGVAIDLAVALAGPALAAVLAFHVASAVCVQALRVVPGQGLLQAAAAVVVIAALSAGATGWTGGFGTAARDQVERAFGDIQERP